MNAIQALKRQLEVKESQLAEATRLLHEERIRTKILSDDNVRLSQGLSVNAKSESENLQDLRMCMKIIGKVVGYDASM